jgi:hypothetical protein
MQNIYKFNDHVSLFSAQIARRRTVGDIPGPAPALPILGTRWIYSVFGRYNLNKVHEAYRGEYRVANIDICQ